MSRTSTAALGLMLLLFGSLIQPLLAQPSGNDGVAAAALREATLEELATGLGRVCDLAIDGASSGPLAVVWAEADPPRLVRWTEIDRRSSDLTGTLPKGAADPIRLLFTAPSKLLVSATSANGTPIVRAVPCPASADSAVSTLDFDSDKLPAPAPLVALFHDGRYVFACTQLGEVYRSRMVAGNFGMIKPLRSVPPLRPVALGLSARGFLTVASSDPEGCSINFFNPDKPAQVPALRVSTKLARVVDLAYGTVPRPHVRQLYVLSDGASSEGAGVYRIDASVTNAGMGCVALPIVAIDRPRAMAFTPEGSLIVATEGETPGTGRLLRVKAEL